MFRRILLLFFIKKKQKGDLSVKGEIQYYNLQDWWLNELTEDERVAIKKVYKASDYTNEGRDIDKGTVSYISRSKIAFLVNMLSWFTKNEYYRIAVKMLNVAEKSVSSETDILDRHFLYSIGIKIYYSNRNNDNKALDTVIEYCKKQIDISKEAKEAFLKGYPNSNLPSHRGFKQLAIVYEKNEQYKEAIVVSKQALVDGWNDDWNRRIDRLQKKTNNLCNDKGV
jgi:hypothetical protein